MKGVSESPSPSASPVLSPVSTLLNGLSQVFIVTNPWAGLLILAGVAWASLPMAALVLLGAAVTTASALLLADAREDVPLGLHGYNGALIGAASFITWNAVGPALATTLLGGLAGSVLTTALARLLAGRALGRLGLPVLTAPFCLTSGVVALLGAQYASTTPLDQLPMGNGWIEAGEGLLGNVSEVILVDNPVTGALILAGLFLASWRVGLAALLGAAGELAVDFATGQDVDKLAHGLLGYSGVLVAIALGAVFVTGSLARRLGAAAGGLALSQLVEIGIAQTPVPAYTWPFILPTWAVLAALALLDRRRERRGLRSPDSAAQSGPAQDAEPAATPAR